MAVIVLMYHHTPAGAPEGYYDVALATFRDQIKALRDAGVPFVGFEDCARSDYVRHGMQVAVTFDDGHASNEAAFRFLADCGIKPMAFIVRDWSLGDRRYLSSAALGNLKDVCDLGAHGATHRALSSLADAELADELAASRHYVEGVRGSAVAAMALPGGHGGRRELAAAARAGFTLVGNSRPLPQARLHQSVNRICINRTHGADAPLKLAQAGALHWALQRARMATTATGRRLLGGRLYGALTAWAK